MYTVAKTGPISENFWEQFPRRENFPMTGEMKGNFRELVGNSHSEGFAPLDTDQPFLNFKPLIS
jgi:hypothetical protein